MVIQVRRMRAGSTSLLLAVFGGGVFPSCSCDEEIGRLRPKLEVSPALLDFSEVPLGATRTLTLGLANSGSALLTVHELLVAAPFSVAVTTASVAAGRERSLEVAFSPTALGGVNGVLSLRSDDPESPELQVALRGVGIQAAVTVHPLVADFGEVNWTTDAQPVERVITISNSGTDVFSVDGIVVEESANGAFLVDEGGALGTYAKGASRTFTARYLPTQMGAVEGRVEIRTTAPRSESITVKTLGFGVGPLVDLCARVGTGAERCLSKNENPKLDFGTLDLGGRANGEFRIINIGTRELEAQGFVQGPAGDFGLAPAVQGAPSFRLQPQADARYSVVYTANDYAFDSIVIGFGTNAARDGTPTLRAEARIRRADINVVPARVTMSLSGGVTHDETTVAIHNCGEATLTLSSIGLRQTTGPAGAMTLANVPSAGTSLVPEDCSTGSGIEPPQASFRVVFEAATNGLYAATVDIASNDPVDPTVHATVEGSRH